MCEVYHEITKTMHNLPLSIFPHKKSPFQIIEAHWHRALEISIVFEGTVDFYNGNHHEVIEKNDISLTNCKEIHFSIPRFDHSENKIVGYTLQINYSFLEHLIPNIEEISFNISKKEIRQQISQYMLKIYELYTSETISKYIKIYALTLEIISLLYEYCQTTKKNICSSRINDILKYIHQNYNENIHLYSIANHFGFSREYFARMFKKDLGISFKQYLINYRLNQSISLLENSQKTIAQISLDVGFTNETQYIIHFKKLFNMTPGQYRKSHLLDK